MTTIDYDLLARDYAQNRGADPSVLKKIIEVCKTGFKVLEIGCGTGNYIRKIRDFTGSDCYGVDPSEGMLFHVSDKQDIHFSQEAAEYLSFSNDHFDLVYSVDVVHHIKDVGLYFQEAYRVLKKGGILITATDSEWIIRNRMPLSHYFPETVAAELKRYHSIDALKTCMEKAGFASIEEIMTETPYVLTTDTPFRKKSFSSLLLIDDEAYQHGLQCINDDLEKGPINCISRYSLISGTKGLSDI